MPKEVQIDVAEADRALLEAANYLLCTARKVNDAYDVVWNAASINSQYLITLSPNYQLFATNSFVAGAVVAVETNVVEIGLGQQATLDAAGVLGTPVSGGPSDSITLVNNYGLIHPGLSTGNQPIYVEPGAIETGYETLKPVDMVRIWFQQDITTGTMLSQGALVAVSKTIEVDLTARDKVSLLYQNGNWSIVGP